ncbi:MAG: ABC transporter ATP-binding protein [Deltaproteobacteria bacterium]|nr:ABC transporter ATP-binding protein [Deltaproteobacteria bacterium]
MACSSQVQVHRLSKRYRLGQQTPTTLRDAFQKAWLRALRREEELTPIGGGPELEFWALKDVSFTMKSGEILGIIGNNGSGKSTLLKILSRITEPTEGQAILKGRVSSLLEVGTGFHPDLTGRENIFLNGAIIGMNRREIFNQFDAIVSFAEMERFIDTPVKRYSSGMFVRLAFAIAAHLNPDVLMIDEVLAVGDANFQKKCLQKSHDVSRSGKTVIFVSHDLGVVRHLCHRVICLDHGQVVGDGSPGDIIGDYQKRCAA